MGTEAVPMDIKTYLKISAINLAFLLIGIAIGAIVMLVSVPVHAQAPPPPAVAKAEALKPPQCDESKFECVSPVISGGAAAFGVLLANRTASDQAMVNGFDILKLQQLILNTLQERRVLSAPDVQGIIQSARVEKPLRVK